MPTSNKHKFSLLNFFKNIKLNIGTFIFGALFLYMFVSLIIYCTTGTITSYQVSSGPLAKNQTYTGLALRSETVISADSSGYINYYAREGAKVKKGGIVYTIGDTQTEETEVVLDDSALSDIRSSMQKYSLGFDSNNFHSIYSFKYELEGNILQYSGADDIALENGTTNTTIGNQTASISPYEGIVEYNVDGYESLTAENVSADDFNQKSYEKTNLKSKEKVAAGSDVYKLITDESWSIIIPLTDKQMALLASTSSVKVKFLKDGTTQTGDFVILFQNDQKYGKITFSEGMLRYVTDRYIDIELVTNLQSGLKIPLSSVVKKEFYTIPEEFESYGDNQNDAGFLKETVDKDGNTVTEFVNATLYRKEDGLCYVEKKDFDKGDKIIKSDSSERYIIGDTASLEGVYCINKGYAVFRQITILDQDEEYCIVKTGQSYGIAQFDHIVLNGTSVNEEDILY